MTQATEAAKDFLTEVDSLLHVAEAEVLLGSVFPLEQCDTLYARKWQERMTRQDTVRDFVLQHNSQFAKDSDPRLDGVLFADEPRVQPGMFVVSSLCVAAAVVGGVVYAARHRLKR